MDRDRREKQIYREMLRRLSSAKGISMIGFGGYRLVAQQAIRLLSHRTFKSLWYL